MKAHPLSLAAALAASVFVPASLSAAKITWESIRLSDEFHTEGGAIADINQDGAMDVVSGPYWYEGPDFKKKHTIFPPAPGDVKGYVHHFFSFAYDLNGDQFPDLLTIGFPGQEAWWMENPGKNGGEWKKHVILDVVDNESPQFVDFDGDGKPELICSQNGRFGYAAPDWSDTKKPWKFVPLTAEVGAHKYTHGLGVGDVDGDGKNELLEHQRIWKAPANGEGEWQQQRFALVGKGGAQMYTYDFNGDGRNDLITVHSAHEYGLSWFENTPGENGGITWKRHAIVGEKPEETPHGTVITQMHALVLVDVDGDGVKDVVTGKRWYAHAAGDPGIDDPAVLYWFKTVRNADGSVSFEANQIHADSGVGVDLPYGDANGDGLVDFLTSSKKGTVIHLQKRE